MAKLSALFKGQPLERAISLWEALNKEEIKRKNGKKDKLVLIQNRENAIYTLFLNLKDAGFTADEVKPKLLKILGHCSSKIAKKYEKRGWIKNGSKQIVDTFNEIFEQDVDYIRLIEQAVQKGFVATFIDAPKEEEVIIKEEPLKELVPNTELKVEYIKKGVNTELLNLVNELGIKK